MLALEVVVPVLPLDFVAVVLPLYEAPAADGEKVSTESEPEDSVGADEAVEEAVDPPDE